MKPRLAAMQAAAFALIQKILLKNLLLFCLSAVAKFYINIVSK